MTVEKLRVAITLEQCWHRVPGGTATSAIELVAALQRLRELDVVGVAARHRAMPPAPWAPPVVVRTLPLPRAALYESWHALRWPRVQQATGVVDVVHATTMAIPPKSGPLVVTVHDLAFLTEPAHFTKHGLRFFNRGLHLAKRDADLVLVPSQATYDDCVAAGFPASRLRLVPHGVAVPHVSRERVAAFRRERELPDRYVLWCGTLEPRKNVPALLRAFEQVRSHEPGLELVLVGPDGWGDVEVPATAGVRLLGFLSTADLHAAYAGASAFCYPSLREGFGLPVLEAMAHGVPVVTSASSAMAEFADGAAILVEPRDVDALAHGLLEALGARHDELADAGRKRAAGYSWDAAAALTADAYREVCARPGGQA